jgi:type IV pilus assembly protein PilM
MFDFIKKIIGSKEGGIKGAVGTTAVGVDIGSSSIKVVEVKNRGGRAVLETYGVLMLGPYADLEMGRVTNLPADKIKEAVKEVLTQSNVSAKSAGLSIPTQASLIFTIELPQNVKENEMRAIVETESRKYIPLPITEVSLNYFILPKKEASYEESHSKGGKVGDESIKTEVLVVAIQNEMVSNLKSMSADLPFTNTFFEVETFSSIRANFEHELSLVLLVDFGASKTKVALVEFGMVKGFHTINRGGADITDSIAKSFSIDFEKAEEMKKNYGLFNDPTQKELNSIVRVHVDYIFEEVNSVLAGYEKKYGRTISKVIFTGGGAQMKGLLEVAVNNFRSEVEIGRPFSKVGSPEFLEKILESAGPEFAVAIGLALRKLE